MTGLVPQPDGAGRGLAVAVPGTGGRPPGGAALVVTEFTDAACPWAWGAEPRFRLLRQTLGERAVWRRVCGILFDEDDDPAPDADAEARWYEGFIHEVSVHTHAPFPARLRWLTRTSWPASRAVKAAEAQGEEVGARVLRRLRETTFVTGEPADTDAGVLVAVAGLPGLDTERLAREMASEGAHAAVRADRAETRRPPRALWDLQAPGPHPGRAKELAEGRRYALPTLLLQGARGTLCVPGHRPFAAYLEAAREVSGLPPTEPVRLSATVALERWRTLSGPELTELTTDAQPPPHAVRFETGSGPLWLHPKEARTHPATRSSSPIIPS